MTKGNGHNGRGHRPRLEEIVKRAVAPGSSAVVSDQPAMSRSQRLTLWLIGALFVVSALAILNYGRLALGAASAGLIDVSLKDMLKRAGYESAVTLAAGFNQRADELFTLHRIRVSYPDTVADFAKRLPD